MKMNRRLAVFLSVLLLSLSVLTGCGGKKEEAAPAKAAPQATEKAVPETTAKAVDPNLGVYQLYNFMGFSLKDYAIMTETTEEEAKNSFVVELKEDGSATFKMDDDHETLKWKTAGDKLTLYAEGEDEELEGTVKDGVMILSMEGVDIYLLRDGATPPVIESENNGLAEMLNEYKEDDAAGSAAVAAETKPAAKETKPAETKPAAKETKPAETKPAAKETKPAETKPAAKETKPAADSKKSSGTPKYVLWEYSANGMTVNHDLLVTSGMGDTYIELRDDHTGTFLLFNTPVEVTWNDKEILMYGVSKYPYTIKGDTLTLDMQGVKYTMKRDDSAGSASAETEAPAKEAEAETEPEAAKEASGTAAKTGAAASAASGGDGIVSEEAVQKGYVWMHDINGSRTYDMTYEDLRDYFGVEGEFVKEEYSDHMKRNKRYYKWISEDNDTHFIYVNFDEKDAAKAPGVYTISGYNSSGFTSSEAKNKYLSVLQEEAREAEKAAAASTPMKEDSFVLKNYSSSDTLEISVEYPESGWARKEGTSDSKIYNTDNLKKTFGVGFIQFSFKNKVEDFDFYKDKFKNFKEIGTREIAGIEMTGRTYENIGYEWTEYIAQVGDNTALSVGIVDVDISEGTFGDRILDSVEIN